LSFEVGAQSSHPAGDPISRNNNGEEDHRRGYKSAYCLPQLLAESTLRPATAAAVDLLLSYRTFLHINYLYLPCITDSSFILTTYCQHDVPDPSRRPSRTMLGIEPTVAWAPTCQCCGGSMLSLFRLCIAPGWLG
jgi:hypothetical protein